MKTIIGFIICIVVVALVGCSTTPVGSAQKAGIKTVHVEPRTDSGQGMRYGVDVSAGGLANVIASIIVDSLGQKGVARMSLVMQTNEIIVADLVRAQVAARIQQYPELQLINGDSDGVFVVKILQYGFDTPGLRLAGKVPFIVLHAELLNRRGKRIWSRQTAPLQRTPEGVGATWEEYEIKPEKLRADWNKQIEKVVSQLFPAKK